MRAVAGQATSPFAVGCIALVGAVAAALAPPSPASAQTLLGRVLEDGRAEVPISGAVVFLMDREGARRVQAMTDTLGRFRLAPPEAGEFYVEVVRLGYEPTRSPLIAFEMGGSAPIDLLMTPAPIGLEGFEVTVEREAQQFLAQFGLNPALLGNRWIDRQDIEAVAVRMDAGQILQWQNIPGLEVVRSENLTPGSDDVGLCVGMPTRARGVTGATPCALVVLNGAAVPTQLAAALDPETIEAMALLRPVEAVTFYGTLASGGALLIWTRTGGL